MDIEWSARETEIYGCLGFSLGFVDQLMWGQLSHWNQLLQFIGRVAFLMRYWQTLGDRCRLVRNMKQLGHLEDDHEGATWKMKNAEGTV